MSISQITAPETPNSKTQCHSISDPSLSLTNQFIPQPKLDPQIRKPLFLESKIFDLVPEKENSLKSSLNDLKSSLSSLISSADFFSNSMNTLKKSSDWKLSDSRVKTDSLFTFQAGVDHLEPEPYKQNDSLFTFQAGLNALDLEPSQSFSETKKSSMMSPLRESDLKNSKETSSGILTKSIQKPPGTPVSEMLGSSNKPSSNFNKAFLTLDELKLGSGDDFMKASKEKPE